MDKLITYENSAPCETNIPALLECTSELFEFKRVSSHIH